jgi:manganese transport protein
VLRWRQVVEVVPKSNGVADVLPGEARVLEAAQRSLSGERRGFRALWPFLGPAFIAAVAYVDPGNFATNFAAGAKFGYLLVWVIVASNLMAMLIQTLSAKLGIATGLNLPEVCRERFPRTVSFLLWVQAELIAMATDLAEFIGAALGLHLIFGIPLFPAGVITAFIAFGILALQARGLRKLEATIAGLVGIILAGFAFEVFLARPDPGGAASGLVPRFDGSESVLLAAGILGATVMPHVIYLHSALTQRRVVGEDEREKQRILNFERVDVVIAMIIAGAINLSMLLIGAAVFHATGQTGISELDEVYHGLGRELGSHADVIFGIALLASGISSSSVGTMAGQVVMQGFIRRRIPLFLRRSITMAPALIVIAIGVDPSKALIVSQVVLSFGIPFALVPLVLFTRDRGLMGALVNRRITTVAAFVVAAIIIALNLVLLYLTFSG